MIVLGEGREMTARVLPPAKEAEIASVLSKSTNNGHSRKTKEADTFYYKRPQFFSRSSVFLALDTATVLRSTSLQ